MLIPVESSKGSLEWKIWILSTKLENLDVHPENESLLHLPGRNLSGMTEIDTEVFIIGGGNALVHRLIAFFLIGLPTSSAAALAARLKTFGVESIMAERNARIGDNWAKRYDCMKFHVPTSFCDMPYMGELNRASLETGIQLTRVYRRLPRRTPGPSPSGQG